MTIAWHGHSAFRIEFKDAVVLIDPYIAAAGDRAGRVTILAGGESFVV